MRLIDGDALLRNIRRAVYPSDLNTTIAVGICESHVKDMPTIDAVLVVRCCECKWHYPEYTGELMCTNCPKGQEGTFFCAGGRRREDV